MALSRLLTQEGELMKLRALGYKQKEIADRLGITQSAVSRRIDIIRREAQKTNNDNDAFWKLLVGLGAVYLLAKVFEEVKN